MFEGSLTYCVLCVLWHLVLWTECNNIILGGFNDDNTKTFSRVCASNYNLCITLRGYDVSEHSDVDEHVVV